MLNISQRQEIIRLWKEGWSYRSIARIIGCHFNSVEYVIRAERDNPPPADPAAQEEPAHKIQAAIDAWKFRHPSSDRAMQLIVTLEPDGSITIEPAKGRPSAVYNQTLYISSLRYYLITIEPY